MTRLNVSHYMYEHGKVNNNCRIKFFLLNNMVHNFVTYNQNHYIIVLEVSKNQKKKNVISIVSLSQTYRSKIQCLYFTYFHIHAASNINF